MNNILSVTRQLIFLCSINFQICTV